MYNSLTVTLPLQYDSGEEFAQQKKRLTPSGTRTKSWQEYADQPVTVRFFQFPRIVLANKNSSFMLLVHCGSATGKSI